MRRYLIIGGGQAAVSAAAKLRALDNACAITMVSDEGVLPYQRPPLSKAYLAGTMPMERLALRPREWFDEQRIELQLNMRAVLLDPPNGHAELADGTILNFDACLLATGSRARRLPEGTGDDLTGVHYLRDSVDVDGLREAMITAENVVIVGGGYIGLEVAAVARLAGRNVSVVEAAPRILQRVACSQTSSFFRNLHRKHGVSLLEGQGLDRIEGNDQVQRVRLGDGRLLEANLVLIGIGIVPNAELAEGAGLESEGGVVVDEHCRTSHPSVFAAGDCATFEHGGARLRLESVPNAIHQGEVAAANMAGHAMNYLATPWFWSDQYDVKLQIAGLGTGHDSVVVRHGRRAGALSHWYYKDGELIAVDAMNDAPAFMVARKLIEHGIPVPRDFLANPANDPKSLLAN